MVSNSPERDKNITFILGLPNNKLVTVGGHNDKGELIYSWAGNADFHNYAALPGVTKKYLPLIWHQKFERSFPHPGILVNCINDADNCSKSLALASRLVTTMKERWPELNVFNAPEGITRTTRDGIYQQFHELPGLYVPKVLRVKPESCAHVLQLAAEGGMAFPFLIRTCGSHQSSGLQVIRDANDIGRLERYAFDGSDYYLTEFVNNKNAEGLYNKARLVIIGGKMYARHFMTSPQWMVYADIHTHHMADKPELKTAEEDFLTNYQSIICPEALESLHRITRELGLDYLGFDVAPMADGRLLIFEINAAQNAMLSIDFQKFPYMESIKNNIVGGLHETLRSKAA